MAERKPLFLNQTEGFSEEMTTTDSMTLGGLTMGGDITMEGNKISGLGAGTSEGDALSYGQSSALLSGLDLAGNKITNVANGSDPTDAVNLAQLNTLAAGIDFKESVRVATAAALPAYTRTDNIIEGDSNGNIGTVDGITLVNGDRILVQDGASNVDNGIYVVTASGDSGNPFILTRADDADESAEVTSAMFCHVEEGSEYSGHGMILITNDPITLNTTGLEFSVFNTLADLSAGDGIAISSNTVSVDLVDTNPGLEFIGGDLQIDVVASGGLVLQSDGIQIKIDETPDTLDCNSDGLKVVGLPNLFKINNIAVGSDVTAANIDTLTDGSDAFGLHTHNSEYSILGHTHTHASTTGQTANDHHNQVHDLTGSDHTDSGLTIGHVLTATGSTSFAWQAPSFAAEASRVENDLAVDEEIFVADPVYWTATGDRIGRGDAINNKKSRIIGVAKTAQATPGSTSSIVSIGEAAGILSSATPGDAYYLQNGGGINNSLPSSGRIIQCGIATSADDLWVMIIDYGKRI